MTLRSAAFLFLAVGVSCDAGEASTSMFVCEPACPTGQRCAETGCVVDTPGAADMAVANADDLAAGGCNPPCTGTLSKCDPAGRCVGCFTDGDCPMGQVCRKVGAVDVCVGGCADDSRCGGTALCCDGRCTDVLVDPLNCGTCGIACGIQHSLARCEAGLCTPGGCHSGWGDCNRDPTDGCEAKLDYDVANCNGCGKACAITNAVAGCAAATMDNPKGCYLRACRFGFADCNGDEDDGCEKSTLTDAGNCGACANVCRVPPNARSACRNAACVLDSCNPNFADCDGNFANGCETAILNDPKNCGGCAKACAVNNICVGGACTCPQCNNLFANASAKCVNNMCIFDACNLGYGDCDFNIQNGCETALLADPMNCGGCGKACAPGKACKDGQCVEFLVWTQATQMSAMPVVALGTIAGLQNLKIRISRIGICGDGDISSGPQGFRATDGAGLDFSWGAGQNNNGGLKHYLTPTPDVGGSARGWSYLDVDYTSGAGRPVDVSFILYSDWDGRFCNAPDEEGTMFMDVQSSARAWIKYSYLQ